MLDKGPDGGLEIGNRLLIMVGKGGDDLVYTVHVRRLTTLRDTVITGK